MTETDDKVGLTVRITVKLRPDEYDELFRHVRRIGSTMSAFLRESAATAIKRSDHSPDRGMMPTLSPTSIQETSDRLWRKYRAE